MPSGPLGGLGFPTEAKPTVPTHLAFASVGQDLVCVLTLEIRIRGRRPVNQVGSRAWQSGYLPRVKRTWAGHFLFLSQKHTEPNITHVIGVDSLKGRQAGHRLGSRLGGTRRWARPGSQEAEELLSSGGERAPRGSRVHTDLGVCAGHGQPCVKGPILPPGFTGQCQTSH